MFTITKVTICLIVFFVFSRIALWFQKRLRKSMVILVDIEALFDILPIYQRGKVYIKNVPTSSLFEYMQEHFKEIGVCPIGLNKAIKLQQKGYTLKFMSRLDEDLRPIVAHLLNLWDLRGELYLYSNNGKDGVVITSDVIGMITNKDSNKRRFRKLGVRLF